jgi:hypothetical protein
LASARREAATRSVDHGGRGRARFMRRSIRRRAEELGLVASAGGRASNSRWSMAAELRACVRACAAIAERQERIRGKGRRRAHALQAEETAAGSWRTHSKTDGALARGMSCGGFSARGVVAEKEAAA